MKEEQQIYRIPPKLEGKYFMGGFTPPILLLVMGTGFVGLILTMSGAPIFLVIPGCILIFNWRPTGEKSVWQMLMLRINYFNRDNSYSLEECKKSWK